MYIFLSPLKKSLFDKLLYWKRNMHSHNVQAVHTPRTGLSSLKSLCYDHFFKRNFEVLGIRATTVEEHQAGLLPVSCPFFSCSGFGTSSLIVQSTLFPFVSSFFTFLIYVHSSRLILLSKGALAVSLRRKLQRLPPPFSCFRSQRQAGLRFPIGQMEVSLLSSESDSFPPLTVADFKCMATPPLVSL